MKIVKVINKKLQKNNVLNLYMDKTSENEWEFGSTRYQSWNKSLTTKMT